MDDDLDSIKVTDLILCDFAPSSPKCEFGIVENTGCTGIQPFNYNDQSCVSKHANEQIYGIEQGEHFTSPNHCQKYFEEDKTETFSPVLCNGPGTVDRYSSSMSTCGTTMGFYTEIGVTNAMDENGNTRQISNERAPQLKDSRDTNQNTTQESALATNNTGELEGVSTTTNEIARDSNEGERRKRKSGETGNVKDKRQASGKKRTRYTFSPAQLQTFEKLFDEDHYPKRLNLLEMEQKYNIPEDKLRTWFQNRRAKEKREKVLKIRSQTPTISLKVHLDKKLDGKPTQYVAPNTVKQVQMPQCLQQTSSGGSPLTMQQGDEGSMSVVNGDQSDAVQQGRVPRWGMIPPVTNTSVNTEVPGSVKPAVYPTVSYSTLPYPGGLNYTSTPYMPNYSMQLGCTSIPFSNLVPSWAREPAASPTFSPAVSATSSFWSTGFPTPFTPCSPYLPLSKDVRDVNPSSQSLHSPNAKPESFPFNQPEAMQQAGKFSSQLSSSPRLPFTSFFSSTPPIWPPSDMKATRPDLLPTCNYSDHTFKRFYIPVPSTFTHDLYKWPSYSPESVHPSQTQGVVSEAAHSSKQDPVSPSQTCAPEGGTKPTEDTSLGYAKDTFPLSQGL